MTDQSPVEVADRIVSIAAEAVRDGGIHHAFASLIVADRAAAMAEITRLCAVLVTVCECPHPRTCTDCGPVIHAALRGDWDAVREAGVELEEEK